MRCMWISNAKLFKIIPGFCKLLVGVTHWYKSVIIIQKFSNSIFFQFQIFSNSIFLNQMFKMHFLLSFVMRFRVLHKVLGSNFWTKIVFLYQCGWAAFARHCKLSILFKTFKHDAKLLAKLTLIGILRLKISAYRVSRSQGAWSFKKLVFLSADLWNDFRSILDSHSRAVGYFKLYRLTT